MYRHPLWMAPNESDFRIEQPAPDTNPPFESTHLTIQSLFSQPSSVNVVPSSTPFILKNKTFNEKKTLEKEGRYFQGNGLYLPRR